MSRINSIVQEILEASNGINTDADDGIVGDPVALELDDATVDFETESEESIRNRLRGIVLVV